MVVLATLTSIQFGLIAGGIVVVFAFAASARPNGRAAPARAEAAVIRPADPPPERRRAARWRSVRPAKLRRGDQAATVATFAYELSESGIVLAGPADLEIGEEVTVDVELAVGEPVTCAGRVVRRTDQGHLAVQIEQLSAEARSRLALWSAAA